MRGTELLKPEGTMSPADRARQAAEAAALASPGNARAPIRAAASTLFYECGEMPSAKKLLEILGKGSLTTITDEIRAFWATVRDDARQELEIKGVPDRISEAFRKMAPSIWDEALAHARAEAEERIALAQSDAAESVQAALDERDQAAADVLSAKKATAAAVLQMQAAQLASDGLSSTVDALHGQITELQRQRVRLEDERVTLTEQASQAQAGAQRVQEAADAERRRLMQEIDGLRRSHKGLEATMDAQVIERTNRLSEAHSRELASLAERLDGEFQKNKQLQRMYDGQLATTADLAKQYEALVSSMSGGMKQIEDRVAGLVEQATPQPQQPAVVPAPSVSKRRKRRGAAQGKETS